MTDMNDLDELPVHVQNALRRAGISSAEQARALGREGLAKIPGLGPLALARLFAPPGPEQRGQTLSGDELKRVKRWFDTLQETAPMRLGDGDRALARKIGGWVE